MNAKPDRDLAGVADVLNDISMSDDLAAQAPAINALSLFVRAHRCGDGYDEKGCGDGYRRGVADGHIEARAFTGPPLDVPEQAIVNFDETLGLFEQHGGVAAALHVIAAPIVAAELRRLAALGGAGILELLARAEELENQ